MPVNYFTADMVSRAAKLLREEIGNWAAHANKKPLLQQANEALDLWRAYRVFPYQYFKNDLYLRSVGAEYRSYIPSLLADDYIGDINDATCAHLLNDKITFEDVMQEVGVPLWPISAILTLKQGALELRRRDGSALSLPSLWESMRGHRAIFVKPRGGQGGAGAFRLDVGAQDFQHKGKRLGEADLADVLRAQAHDEFVAQAYFEQHEAMARLHPNSVNTLRIMTLLTGDLVETTAAFLRVGAGGSDTDNWSSGGYIVGLDMKTGQAGAVGLPKNLRARKAPVTIHPDTGLPFASLIVPFARDIDALVHRGARAFPRVRLIGWDVAIGSEGPWIIEGNIWPTFLPVQHVSGGMRDTAIARELAAKLNWR